MQHMKQNIITETSWSYDWWSFPKGRPYYLVIGRNSLGFVVDISENRDKSQLSEVHWIHTYKDLRTSRMVVVHNYETMSWKDFEKDTMDLIFAEDGRRADAERELLERLMRLLP